MLLTNLTIARFQRKIRNFGSLARNQLHMFSGTYWKKKKKGGKSHTINYYGKSGDSRTPDPRQRLYTRNCNGRNYTSYHSWRPSWRPLFAENSRALPLHPARGPTAGPWTPPVWGARYAYGFFRPPLFFCKSWIRHCTHPPLARPSRLPPEASILGELGSSRPPPPPPMEIFGGGGQTYRLLPPPPLKIW